MPGSELTAEACAVDGDPETAVEVAAEDRESL
jgi:hypothetical protein